MLVETEKLPAFVRVKLTHEQDAQTGSVPSEQLMLQESFGDPLSLQLLYGLSQSQSIRLGEEVRHEFLVGAHRLSRKHDGRLRVGEADELGRNGPTLVHQLVETVLSVRSWLTEDDGASLNSLR